MKVWTVYSFNEKINQYWLQGIALFLAHPTVGNRFVVDARPAHETPRNFVLHNDHTKVPRRLWCKSFLHNIRLCMYGMSWILLLRPRAITIPTISWSMKRFVK